MAAEKRGRGWHPSMRVRVTAVAAVKAGQLHDLGVSPAVGVTVNLVHSTAAFLLFLVVTARVVAHRHREHPG